MIWGFYDESPIDYIRGFAGILLQNRCQKHLYCVQTLCIK